MAGRHGASGHRRGGVGIADAIATPADPQGRGSAPEVRWELRTRTERFHLNREVAAHLQNIVAETRARSVLPISDPTFETARRNVESSWYSSLAGWRLHPEYREMRPIALAPVEAAAVAAFIDTHCTATETKRGTGRRFVMNREE